MGPGARLSVAACALTLAVALPGAMHDGGIVVQGRGSVLETDVSSVAHESWHTLASRQGAKGDVARELFDKVAGYPETGELPAGFADEVFDPAVLGRADVYAEEGVVCAFWEKKPSGFEALVERELLAGGWQRRGVTDAGSTFVKSSGAYRWLHMSVYDVAESATVVLGYERAG